MESDDNLIEINFDNDIIQDKKSDNKSNRMKKTVSNKNSNAVFPDKIKINKKRNRNDNIKDIKKKSKKSIIQNSLPELEDCYEKLKVLISKNNFIDVVFNILKIFNGISENDKNKDKLFNEIVNITSNIKDKCSIIMICLSIMLSNNSLNNKIVVNPKEIKEKIDNISESIDIKDDNLEKNSLNKEYREIDEEEEINNNIVKINEITIINGMKNFKNDNYLFGNHYFKKENKVHCFKPRRNQNKICKTFNCYRNPKGCKAQCIVDKKNDTVNIIGIHNHKLGYPVFRLIHNYPCLNRKRWNHIQIFKVNNEDIIVCQK